VQGDVLRLEFASAPEEYAPSLQKLELRAADGSLRAFLAFGGELDDLDTPPEISVTQGESSDV
jgi:hypothetical protein